ncbi:uncharacterized protein BJ171DRAFT_506342 [Polychytrium aggregatum]|uniref:uncharacterized protein n=1 Tax=Polychytrium aggregatum TaxID=110093 RepID=UPI0022FE84DD|nr:uncharacterized protein BJ171DRAFT_506342 [Polychytrium aggregatum]KAI9204171.1 hypothetical protein BJ171DRAFT_506342 [Polychytrium aggregatum]
MSEVALPKLDIKFNVNNRYFLTGISGETRVITSEHVKPNQKLHVSESSGCEFVVDATTSKICIERCNDMVVKINGRMIASTVEVWLSNNVTFEINVPALTLQAEQCRTVTFHFNTRQNFQSLYWNRCLDIAFEFRDEPELPKEKLTSGIRVACTMFKSLYSTDQFLVELQEGNQGLSLHKTARNRLGYICRIVNAPVDSEKEGSEYQAH